MNTLVLDEVVRRVHNLPSLPLVVLELLASIDQEDVNIDALALTMAQDQALTVKTLRLANSSFYGMAHQVATLPEAIAILGFRTVRRLATTTALMGILTDGTQGDFNIVPFWHHAIASAVCARVLAPHLKINPEHAYTAGLLHDIGRLVLVTQFPSHYATTMAHHTQHGCPLLDSEQAVLGVDHAVVGQALMRHWKFPETMQLAVASHHTPPVAGAHPLSLAVIAANTIAHALDLSMGDGDSVAPLSDSFREQLGMDEKTLWQVFAETEKQFEGARLVLNS